MLAAMHQAVFADEPWGERSFGVLLAQPGVMGWIDPRGGFLLARAVLDEAEILTFGVGPRRQGIATGLLRHAMAALRGLGVGVLHLEVAAGNDAARALYAKAGFAPAGVRPRYYADGGDALMLRRVMTEGLDGA